MEPSSLSQFYDDLKSRMDASPDDAQNKITRIQSNPAGGLDNSTAGTWRMKAVKCRDQLVDDCRKHILVDVYCHICPLDPSYIQSNMGQMKQDVDQMLQGKDMSATQYLTSAFEKTRAPLVEYVLWATDTIGRQYMEEADAKLKDAKENDVELPDPDKPNVDDKEVEAQLVDVKKDSEYENFMDQLKAKTVKKIVSDVSKLINDKKEEADMEFNPAESQAKLAVEDSPVEESVFGVCMDYMVREIGPMMESVQDQEQLMGLAIREATLNEIDRCFQMEGADLERSRRRIQLGKGYLVNKKATKKLSKNAGEEGSLEDMIGKCGNTVSVDDMPEGKDDGSENQKPQMLKWTPKKKK